MTIIVFLIDTSASMNTRCYLGRRLTYLDLAKEAVDTFVKARLKCGDRYLLLTFEDPPFNIKSGWKENMDSFMYELKNLKSSTLTTMARALKNTFDLLNIHRMQSGIDTYGQGRHPFYLEPAIIILITDGGKLNEISDIRKQSHSQQTINAGMLPTVLQYTEGLKYPKAFPIPGYELTTEPFRWDQRLFSLVLRLPGTPCVGHHSLCLVPSDMSPIDYVCEATGGRSYCVTSHKILMQCIDSILQKVQSGVVISFEKFGPDPHPPELKSEPTTTHNEEWKESLGPVNPKSMQDIQSQKNNRPLVSTSSAGWHKCRKQIYVARSTVKGVHLGNWPIPESFWPDSNSLALPPRTAHPKVLFTCKSQEPMLLEGLPFDKYELEPSPLTQFILSRKQPMVCWQTFVANSSNNSSNLGYPFGYLKASINLTCVYLIVLPYNYPILLPLLAELFNSVRSETNSTGRAPQSQLPNIRPSYEWRTRFNNYLRTIPPYYLSSLKRVLSQKAIPEIMIQALIPDTMDNYLSFTVINYLKQLKKEAKAEFEHVCSTVGLQNKMPTMGCQNKVQVEPRLPFKKQFVSHPSLKKKFRHYCVQSNDFSGFFVGLQQSCGIQPLFQAPGYVPRDQLFAQYRILKEKVFNSSDRTPQYDDEQHTLPVGQMGNYQAYLKNSPVPLRDIDPPSDRKDIFGNPFDVDKMMVDEADVANSSEDSSSPNQGRPTRNRPLRVRCRRRLNPRKHPQLSTIVSSSQARLFPALNA